MSDHARLPPSNSATWEPCPGSRAMCELYPKPADDPSARDGTAAHWVFSEMFAGRSVALSQIAPNGVAITDEMLDGAELFVDTVRQLLPSGNMQIEQQVVAPNAIHPDNWGTPDVAGWQHHILHVIDYKFGHRFVDAFECMQLINYAILILAGVDGFSEQHINVQFTVVQPRNYHPSGPVRSWSCRATDLRPYMNRLRMAAEVAMQPNAPLRVNAGCLDCSARHACPALQAASMAAADESYRLAPMELPPAALGLELRIVQQAIARLQARELGLSEQASARIKAGGIVPGFRLERGQGRTKWNKPVEEVIALGEMMQISLLKPDAITPLQAIAAGMPRELVDAYSERFQGAAKLIEDNGSLARKIFNL